LKPLIFELDRRLRVNEAERSRVVAIRDAVEMGPSGVEVYAISPPSLDEIAAAYQHMSATLASAPDHLKREAREQLQRVLDEYIRFPKAFRVVRVVRRGGKVIDASDFFLDDVAGATVDGVKGAVGMRPLSSITDTMFFSVNRRYPHLFELPRK
jgi:hypothetical protein